MMRDKKILWITITVYVLVMAGSSFWKYQEMRYNAIDLAYYNQVFWKTIHGDFFGLTIHPHISLGDHVEPVIVFLAPFYALWPDARMLLLLQSLALALAALPIYSLASLLIGRKKVMHHNAAQSGAQKNLPLFLSLLWLLNPLTQNANLFEFHTLPFALLPLFYAIIAYEERKIGRFILWSLLALTVREDVALVIAAFALLAFIDVIKRRGVAPEGIPSRPEATGTHPRRVEGDGVAEDGKVRRRQDPEHLSTGPRADGSLRHSSSVSPGFS